MTLHYHNLLAEMNFWIDIPADASLVSYVNPFGKDVIVSCEVVVKTANGSAIAVDIGVDNAAPYASNDGLIDSGDLNATGVVARGTNGKEWQLLEEDGAIVIDLSVAPHADLDAMITFVAYPYQGS